MPRSLLLKISVGAGALVLFVFGCVHPPEDVKSALSPYQPGEPSNFHQGAEHRRPPVSSQFDAGSPQTDAAASGDAASVQVSDAAAPVQLSDAAAADAAVAPTAGGTS